MPLTVRRSTWITRIEDPAKRLELLLEEGVATLGLPVRRVNTLEAADIITIGDLLDTPAPELLELPNFGPRALQDVLESLRLAGFPVPRKMRMNELVDTVNKNAVTTAEEMLPATAALSQCLDSLFVIVNNLLADDPESRVARQLLWVIDYAKARRPYPLEDAAETVDE